MNEFGKLLGTYVKSVAVSKDGQHAIRFKYAFDDYLYIGTDADCCSETWFADIIGFENIIKNGASIYCQQVIGVTILELPDPKDGRTRQEHDQAYGIRLTTSKGNCDIIYRNSSNGYYGGSEEPMSAEDGEKLEWEEITGDWQACQESPDEQHGATIKVA